MSAPKVSVLMSVYNGERYLCEAVDSILNQTFTDFELVIVDDGSTDSTAALLDGYTDPRIVRLRNPQNIGLTRSLNRGLDTARGEYIARMDADDISLPDRLEKQVIFLDQRPEIGVLGTNVIHIDADGQPMNGGRPVYQRPSYPMHMRWHLLWANAMPHPSVMLRWAALDQNGLRYDPQFHFAQDYDLWNRLNKFYDVFRMLDVCLLYRVTDSRITSARKEQQRAAHYTVMRREVQAFLGDDAQDEAIDTFFNVIFDHDDSSVRDFAAASRLLACAYRRFLALPMSDVERRQISDDAVFYLLKIARKGGRKAALSALWDVRSFLLLRVIAAKGANFLKRRISKGG